MKRIKIYADIRGLAAVIMILILSLHAVHDTLRILIQTERKKERARER